MRTNLKKDLLARQVGGLLPDQFHLGACCGDNLLSPIFQIKQCPEAEELLADFIKAFWLVKMDHGDTEPLELLNLLGLGQAGGNDQIRLEGQNFLHVKLQNGAYFFFLLGFLGPETIDRTTDNPLSCTKQKDILSSQRTKRNDSLRRP